jgi:hypothetical protein
MLTNSAVFTESRWCYQKESLKATSWFINGFLKATGVDNFSQISSYSFS